MKADFPVRAFFSRLLKPSGAALLGVMAACLTGCGKSEKGASAALQELRYQVTADDLLFAAEAGDLKAIPLFLAAGIPVDATDAEGNTALIRAAAGVREDVVALLLDEGADPHAISDVGRTALMTLIRFVASHRGFAAGSCVTLGFGAPAAACFASAGAELGVDAGFSPMASLGVDA